MRKLTWRFLLLTLAWLTLSRLGLSVWCWTRVHTAGGVWPVLVDGWRIDASLLALVCAVPLLLSPWLGHLPRAVRITAWWYRAWWLLMALLELSTPQFMHAYGTRPNWLYVEHLRPLAMVQALWHGYQGALLAVIALAILGWVGFRLLRPSSVAASRPLRSRVAFTGVALVLLALVAHGTLERRPLNAATVAFSDDSLVNSLPLNSAYSVFSAIGGMRHERRAATLYGQMPEPEMQALMRAAAGLDQPLLDSRHPVMHHQQASAQRAKPLNLVIIVEGGLDARNIGTLGGAPLSPQFDALAKQGWLLARTYATGIRSMRGLAAVITGFPPVPVESVLQLPRSQSGFFTIAGLLGEYGYHSRFIYGGKAQLDKAFFLGNGFDQVIERPKFALKPKFAGASGVSDEDLFNELHQRLLRDGDKPNFTLALSVANHAPWAYPAGRIQATPPVASAENAARYADWALGQFFVRARQSAYWEHTVFLIVGDGASRVSGAGPMPLSQFHVPALILGAGVPVQRDAHIVSQIDLAPTLLSLMGISGVHPMPGSDLTVRYPDRAIMQYGDNHGYLKDDHLLVLQPHQAATQFRYQAADAKLSAEPTDPTLAHMAQAQALWSSWAYFNQRYALPAASLQHAQAPVARPAPTPPALQIATPVPKDKCCATLHLKSVEYPD